RGPPAGPAPWSAPAAAGAPRRRAATSCPLPGRPGRKDFPGFPMDAEPLCPGPGALEALLEKLCGGDAEAAERVFRAYEPYLRKAVRRRRPPARPPKCDSADVVQSVWVDLLRGFREAGWRFADVAHLRAFLVRVTYNRSLDRARQAGGAARREEPLAEAAARLAADLPRPSECAQ